MKNRWVLFVPLAIMGLLFGAFIYRLVTPAETLIRSQWIDKPMPLFDLPPATAGVEGLKSSQLADGKPRLVNVFASWCIPCRAEAPQLEALKKAGIPIDGIAIRVPTPDVSLTELTVEVERPVTIDEVNAAYRAAAAGPMEGILAVSDEELVSVDYTGNPHSCIIDSRNTNVVDGTLVKVSGWYDNEWGYSSRCVDLLRFVGARL